MMSIRFPSVLNPTKVGYEWTNDSMTFWNQARNSNNVLHMSAGFYETYGDGNCQHTPLVACNSNQMTDFCLSLTRHLLAHPEVEFRSYPIQFEPTTKETVLFLASIEYNADKRQWFNTATNKLSASESKAHDKRWFQVPAWADGSVASAVGLFNLAKGNPREETLNLFALHEFFYAAAHGVVPQGKEWERITAYQTQIPGDFTAAFRALQYFVKAHDYLASAKRTADCCEHNSQIKEQAA